MPTNLHIDQELLDQAVKVGKHKTKREAVNRALADYVRHHQQLNIKELFGIIDYYPDYDPKQGRKKR